MIFKTENTAPSTSSRLTLTRLNELVSHQFSSKQNEATSARIWICTLNFSPPPPMLDFILENKYSKCVDYLRKHGLCFVCTGPASVKTQSLFLQQHFTVLLLGDLAHFSIAEAPPRSRTLASDPSRISPVTSQLQHFCWIYLKLCHEQTSLIRGLVRCSAIWFRQPYVPTGQWSHISSTFSGIGLGRVRATG